MWEEFLNVTEPLISEVPLGSEKNKRGEEPCLGKGIMEQCLRFLSVMHFASL